MTARKGLADILTVSRTRTRIPLGRCGLHGQKDGGHSPVFRPRTQILATDGEAMPRFVFMNTHSDGLDVYQVK